MPNPRDSGLPNPASYSLGAGVVVDDVTGLTWQEPIASTGTCSGGCTYQDAVMYCKSLALAGASWRLPTRIELVSLLDHTQNSGELLDPAYFQSTGATCFWTSTQLTNSGSFWYVDFASGNILYNSVNTSCHVRCVH
jgi:hypothetical protein